MKAGKGVYFYENGNCYDGDWKDDLKENYGIYKYACKSPFNPYLLNEQFLKRDTRANERKAKNTEWEPTITPTEISTMASGLMAKSLVGEH